MAKVTGIIDRGIIRRFKGKLDFYGRRGKTYVRSWPRRASRAQTHAERLAQCHLTLATRLYWCQPTWMRDQYASLTTGMWWNRRDYFYKMYFGTIDPWPPLAWGHHPPQPSPCGGGDGHYWAMLWSNAEASNTFQYRLHFWFDQPLRYLAELTREKPWFGTHINVRSNIRCEMGRAGAYAGVATNSHLLLQISPHHFNLPFTTFPFSADRGRWYGYIRAEHPITGHMSLSKTPWFVFEVPEEYPMLFPTGRRGIDFREAAIRDTYFYDMHTLPMKTEGDLFSCTKDTIE